MFSLDGAASRCVKDWIFRFLWQGPCTAIVFEKKLGYDGDSRVFQHAGRARSAIIRTDGTPSTPSVERYLWPHSLTEQHRRITKAPRVVW
jgi:hypothetical protein